MAANYADNFGYELDDPMPDYEDTRNVNTMYPERWQQRSYDTRVDMNEPFISYDGVGPQAAPIWIPMSDKDYDSYDNHGYSDVNRDGQRVNHYAADGGRYGNLDDFDMNKITLNIDDDVSDLSSVGDQGRSHPHDVDAVSIYSTETLDPTKRSNDLDIPTLNSKIIPSPRGRYQKHVAIQAERGAGHILANLPSRRHAIKKLRDRKKESIKGDRVRKYQTRSQSAIYTVMQHRRQSWYKFKQNVKEVVSQVGVWSKSFKVIEGHFGTAILSYFHFVRWLMFLNLFIAILMFIFITVPYLVLQSHSTYEAYTKEAKLPPTIQLNEAIECSQNYTKAIEKDGDLWKGITYLLDFLQGTGFMERTVLFYGVYFNKTYTIHDVTHTYNMSLAYILVTAAYFLISFVLIVKNSAEGLKATQIVHEGAVVHYCNKVFGGWDYCITNAKSAKLKHKNIHHEFEVDLNEQTLAIERKGRSTLRWAKLYFVRLAVNVIVLVLLIGALSLIFFTNEWSMQLLVKDEVKNNKPLLLLVEFLPSITISVLNIIIPEIFGVIVKPEDYSPSFEVYITLIRTVFLRLASIGILMISLYVRLVDGDVTRQSLLEITGRNETFIPTCGNKDFDEIKCWETYIGQQLYKLVLLDFLVIVFVTFLVEFPRQFIYTKLHKRIGLIEKIGQQEFDLPKNVLEIVYSQVLCWLGAFFSPLIPVMCFMKCFFFFYVKKLSLLTNCQPPNRPYRASKANAFFMGILLISFILAALPIGYTIGRIPPSKSCGPFRLYNGEEFTIFDTITNMLLGWPDVLRDIFFVLGSPAFFVPAVLILCLVMYYYWAVAQGHKRMAKILRNQLASEGRDKQFLLSRVSAALRRRDRGRS